MIKFHIIESGYFMADGGAMFGPIPKIYWERKYLCNENNLCVMAMRCLFVETENRCILIDTGLGSKHEVKFYQPHNLKDIVEEIDKLGYKASDITDVVLTHLHFDHCGYATCFDENKKAIPTFPNATYWLSKAQWENYRNPLLYEKDAFFANNIEPVFDSNQLNLIEKDTVLFEGFALQLYDGHSPGQIAAFIDTDNEKIVYPGDVVPTAGHVSLGWLSAFDNNAALAMEEKKRLLDKVVKEERTAIFYHDAHVVSAKIVQKNGHYFIEDVRRK
jgi:glyoxylase-like metal-dependent hydrolase (beta-lactamase superfamily II)